MHASRDDRASTRDAIRQPENKIIPTPKHMTAKPTGKFDFDQSDQVRMSPGPTTPPAIPALQGRTELGKSATATPGSAPATARAVGGLTQNNRLYSSTSANAARTLAQAQGQLVGTVLDRSGAVVPNATLVMDGPIGTRAVQSDVQGQFSFDRLTPGSYSLKAEARGFKTAELQQVAVRDDKPANLRVTLEPGAASEPVEVSASAQPAEVSAVTGSSHSQVESAPGHAGRNRAANRRGGDEQSALRRNGRRSHRRHRQPGHP